MSRTITAKLKQLKARHVQLTAQIQRLESIQTKRRVDPEPFHLSSFKVIEFDGGTSCNNPKLGYGQGYGSFQIDGGEIHRVKFGIGHSCNSAEIATLTAALEFLAESGYAGNVLARGDSQIALKWATSRSEPSPKTSQIFQQSIPPLRKQVSRFFKVRTEWRSRIVSVKIFGH